MLKAGDNAPGFTLQTDAGDTVTLSQLKGKNVVLFFYPKDATSGCTKEAIGFRDHLKDFEALNAVVLGLSKDSVKSHVKFKEKEELNFPLLADTETEVNQLYGVWKEKSMYGRTYFGTNRSTFLIDESGKILHVWYGVKVPGHVEEVLETLKKAVKGE